MKIAYTTGFRRGHAHKIMGAIHDSYPGFMLDVDSWDISWKQCNDQVSQQIIDCKPDLLVCSGHPWSYWNIARRHKTPYVLVIGDVASMRLGSILEKEQEMFFHAEGAFFTSEEHVLFCSENGFVLPPFEIVYLRPQMKDMLFDPLPKIPGRNLVYAGSAQSRKKGNFFGYRAYADIFAEIIKRGWNMHIYPATDLEKSDRSCYLDRGCVIHDPVTQEELPRELSQYTAGFQGYNLEGIPPTAASYALRCRPNKLWEYLSAGIPTIGYNTGNGGKIYDGKWGIVLKELSQIEHVELPVITEQMRMEQTIDQDAPRIKRFLESII